MGLKSNELDWLARHLGHDIAVHREFYRLPSHAAEVAKVGKLLMAAEKGLREQSGKTLDDVELSDIEQEDEESDTSAEGRMHKNATFWLKIIYQV